MIKKESNCKKKIGRPEGGKTENEVKKENE